MDIFDALNQHHDVIRDLFERAKTDSKVFDDVRKHLQVHHRNEEIILYDSLKTNKELRKDALEAVEEHHVIEMLLLDVDGFPREHERWAIKLEVLEEYTRHHLKEEEEDIFPAARKAVNEKDAQGMGRRFEEVKNRQLPAVP